ncbi:MAG: SPOR domain-containing protein [Mangrovibacterium sp.]
MKFSIVGVLLFLLSWHVCAQEVSSKPSSGTPETHPLLQQIDIRQDARIDSLLQNHVQANKRREGTDGFRLEIFFRSGVRAREEAMNVKTEFLRKYPEETAYMSFQSPDFKVRVGDCRSKSEALKLKAKIKKDYPNAFMVPDIIQFPKLYTDIKQQ